MGDEMIRRAERTVRQARRILSGGEGASTWRQISDDPEQFTLSGGGRSGLVERSPGPDDPPWTWSHYDTDISGPEGNGAEYPSAWGRLHTREDAMRAVEEALAHPSGEGNDPGSWIDMRHRGWDPRDQGSPRTFTGDPALRSDAPADPEVARRVLRPGVPYKPERRRGS